MQPPNTTQRFLEAPEALVPASPTPHTHPHYFNLVSKLCSLEASLAAAAEAGCVGRVGRVGW